jgi:transcriptional regulator with XRE-family HTH domain
MDDYSRLAVNLGRKLRQIRRSAGLTQDRVGIGLGFRPQSAQCYISYLETGRLHLVTMQTVQTFLRVCGTRLAAISELQDELPAMSIGPDVRSPRPRQRRHASAKLPQKGRTQEPHNSRAQGREGDTIPNRSDSGHIPVSTPEKSEAMSTVRKSRSTPLRLVLYNLQWSAVNEAVRAFLSQVDMSDILRAHARQFAHEVLALVRKYEEPEELKVNLDRVCDTACAQGQKAAVVEHIVNIVLKQYYVVLDAGPGLRDQGSGTGASEPDQLGE